MRNSFYFPKHLFVQKQDLGVQFHYIISGLHNHSCSKCIAAYEYYYHTWWLIPRIVSGTYPSFANGLTLLLTGVITHLY